MFEPHYAMAIAAAFLVAVGHLLLKRGASAVDVIHLRLWLNPRSMAGYALLFVTTLMNLFAYKIVPLRANVILTPLTLLTVTILSVMLLGERMTRTQAIGCLVIVAGVAVFNL